MIDTYEVIISQISTIRFDFNRIDNLSTITAVAFSCHYYPYSAPFCATFLVRELKHLLPVLTFARYETDMVEKQSKLFEMHH